jgi:hypothetical protein
MHEEEKAVHQRHHSLVLEETVIARLDQIYNTRAHGDKTMDLTNYILLACERNMLSNKFGLDIFYTAFVEAAQTAPVETGHNQESDRRVLVRDNFFLSLTQLAKAIYSERARDENIGAFEIMFAEML